MTDPAGNGSVECESCGAVWIVALTTTDGGGSDGSACLNCGGVLVLMEETDAS